MFPWMQMQYRALKSDPAMISFMENNSSAKMGGKIDDQQFGKKSYENCATYASRQIKQDLQA